MKTQRIELSAGTLTRVGYLDVSVPPELVGLSSADLANIDWRTPHWSETGQIRVGVAAWFAELAGTRVVFDPVMAADEALRANPAVESAQQTAIAERFEAAGFPRESVDLVVVSHVDGVGMVGWRDPEGAWSPFFPNANILLSDVALAELRESAREPGDACAQAAWRDLLEQGAVREYTDGQPIVPGLFAAVNGGHGAGHAVFHFGATVASPDVSMIGHLAISPLHLAVGECPSQHEDAALAWSLLETIAADGRTLIGPLWPSPGFGRWCAGTFAPNGAPGLGG